MTYCDAAPAGPSLRQRGSAIAPNLQGGWRRRIATMRYTIVIPVRNQLRYSMQCIESLIANGVPVASVLVVDNGSTDGTPQWLASRSDIRSVRNVENIGCGGAWTQGTFLSDSEWVVFLNNDIVCAHDFIGAQLDAAEREGLEVVSPSMVEFDLDYDLTAFTAEFLRKMAGTVRRGWFHGVCFSVKRSVFHRIGFLDTDRLLFGREDAEFLARCRSNGIAVGTVGDAFMHHFGSITQRSMMEEQGVTKFGDHRYLYTRIGLNWWGRQRAKFERKSRTAAWSRAERQRVGLTLHMVHRGGRVEYR